MPTGNMRLLLHNYSTFPQILKCPSFLLGQLGTFALIKLLTLRWGTLFIKMRSYLLEV